MADEIKDAEARADVEMLNPDPYCPVRMTRILDTRGAVTDKFMTEVQTPEQVWRPIPGVRTVHGAGYRLVTNAQVRDMAHTAMEATKLNFEQVPSWGNGHSRGITWNGKYYLERWYTKDVYVEAPNGSKVMLGLEVRNSYDDSCKVGLAFFAMHCACSNQFFSHNMFGKPFTFSHIGDGGELDDELNPTRDALLQNAGRFGAVLPHIKQLCDARFMTMQEFLDLRRRMAVKTKAEFRDRQILDELAGDGITKKLGIEVGQAYGTPDSYWALANAYTAVTTHMVGGLRGQELSQRATDFLIQDARAKTNAA